MGSYEGEAVVLEELGRVLGGVLWREFGEEFRMLEFIDKGNYASVYRCRRVADGAVFAVKVIDKYKVSQLKKGKESVFNEANVLRSCSHPNLLTLHEVY